MGYLYIAVTVFFTVCGQVLLKWRLTQLGPLPEGLLAKFIRLFGLLLDPAIFMSLFCAFLGALTWMAALSKLDLSHAYPYMSSAFVLVLGLSVVILKEPLTVPKLVGITLITLGMGIAGRG
jgi:multidrug transporter EmrE-like cation transporter